MSSGLIDDGSTGRSKQRLRTRQAIMRATQRLLEEGRVPTVAEAADAADVSRATAYRYYPSQDSLLSECNLLPGFPTPEELWNRPDVPAGVEDRVVFVHDFMYDFITAREEAFRLHVRGQLLVGLRDKQDDRALRPGFRIGLLDTALEPIEEQIDAEVLRHLKRGLTVLIGTEAIIALKDVLLLDQETARAESQWACRQLVRAVLAEQGVDDVG